MNDSLSVEERLERALIALEIIQGCNRLKNDRDAYLHAVGEWGMCKEWGDGFNFKPHPEEFGID